MIFIMHYMLLLLQLCIVRSLEISKRCVCGHVQSQKDCKNSGFCSWQNEQCILNSNQYYNTEINYENPCKSYAQEDCREQEQCGFYFGECIDFLDCSNFDKDNCQESSYKCFSDGSKCVEIQDCSDYTTENACANNNQHGKYCIWIGGLEKKCKNVTMCEELPVYLTDHYACKSGLDGCTISEKGYGCIEQMESCTQYVNNFQCFESKLKKLNCFWNSKSNNCVEKVCENLPFTQDYECKLYLSQCTTNGVHCVTRKQCEDAENKLGCGTDASGRKCEYHENKCKIKSCSTAPESLTNYQQCQDYDDQLDCVTSEKKGCKIRPQICDGYVYETDCKSQEQQDCAWQKGKCEQRQCYHAPVHYTHTDCKEYGNCTGKLNGGCQATPQLCEDILQKQFCELNYNKERCIWLDGMCELLECKKLKLPNYNSHKICQMASQYCTFNFDSLGCTDYLCKNVLELEYCTIDSNGTVCTITQGCVEKKCKIAPPSYDTNSKCEGWMPQCTVNVQILSNQIILIGCMDKKSTCALSIKIQCYSTFSGLLCKWDQTSKKCDDQLCTDANPSLYFTNEDCNSFKVLSGPCIIGASGVGCQVWPNNCTKMVTQQQCQLNLQDQTMCFWTGTYCKKQQCSDAPKMNYTNNVECNSWSNNCIFDHFLGGCKDRIDPVSCSSSPSISMYDNHQECNAWNPKCTVVSSFSAEGCEIKKATCDGFIRKRNCKTTLHGLFCYWDDKEQKCMNEDQDNNGVADCHKRLYGDITHQDCQEFLPKCTINNIVKSCQSLSSNCDYQYKQQCEITNYQQPCKWDNLNQKCKDRVCADNNTAQTEAECLMFRRLNQCQLKISSNGTYGPGCENRPSSCESITDAVICKLTLTTQNDKCYYYNSKCQGVSASQCEVITESKSNDYCQLYNTHCALQPSGQGCYSLYSCYDLSNKICSSAIMINNYRCSFSDICRNDHSCQYKYPSYNNCDGQKTQAGQLCYYQYSCADCNNQCLIQTAQKNQTFTSSATLTDKRRQCQDYSTSYRYDTTCDCCLSMTSCSQQVENFCNSSTDQNGSKCGYNSSINLCEVRKCEHLTSNYVISKENCFNWQYNCVFNVSGCITFTGDCTTISIIQQCYSLSCFWQDGKCVNHVDCDLNTTAVTNRECLLSNSTFCRLNYTIGQGCAFSNCSQIKDSTICSSAKISNSEKCKWIDIGEGQYICTNKYCYEFTNQLDCENSYGYIEPIATQCYWCSFNSTKCSNSKYCSGILSIISPQSHQDCNNYSVQQTINITWSQKCTVKKQQCSEYTYEEACVSTIDGIDCIWYSNACIIYCKLAVYYLMDLTDSSCFSWKDSCMSLNNMECQILDCSQLTIITDCTNFTPKCFWDGLACLSIGDCSKYSDDPLCSSTNNSQGIPCFWDGTECLEKTCSNKPTPSINQTECDNWLINCQWNSNDNRCVEDCTQANISNNTHQLCESYFLNKNCTVKLDQIQCEDLPFSCSLAKKTQCYNDQFGNECFFQVSSNQCVNFTCSNLLASYTTHEKCNSRLKSCTVNSTLDGCQQLNVCSSYSIKEQCEIDQNNVECQWMIDQNKCTIKNCLTAQLPLYSAHSCHQYFGNSCTVNETLNGCQIGESLCMKYTYNQCKSEGQMNLSGVNCFWNEDRSICLEKICQNGPPLAQSHSECIGFLSTCSKGGCRIKECFDYNYAIDSACASIFESKKCATNGYQCVLRKACEDANVMDGCTFDINLNPCVWINDKCYIKTCETASISLTKYQECNAYISTCTAKQGGGCTIKRHCRNYQIKEACYTDSENVECIWDDTLNQCFSNQCIDFCGDGIVSSKEEECDDGNYLPYDGCYKCQVQCPQGCNICNGSMCEDCHKQGWVLINGICNSICGDGYIVGNEFCDDGNQIKFDGCYQCSYSCHQKCLYCFQGICLLCEKGYLENESQCHTVCGDSFLVLQLEQCDDGNNQNNDGCSDNCQVESDWKCQQENNISVCNYSIQPKIILTKLTKTNQYQEFQLSFSEQVRLNITNINDEQFLQMIVIVIEGAKDYEYDIEIKPVISITSIMTDASYKILVYFKSSISNPVLKLTLRCENIVNAQDNTLASNEAKLVLSPPNKMSNESQSLILKTALLGQIVMYFILIVGGVAFLAGNLEILWNLLDMLQQLSYLKFHNLQFPENLYVYFEIFTIGSFTPIINNLQTDIYLHDLFDFEIPIILAKWKFEYYQINCYFFNNLQTLVTVIIIGFVYFVVSYFFYKFLVLIKYQNWPVILDQMQSQRLFQLVRFIFSLQRLARKQYQYFIYSGLIRIFTSNFYEITFASILQIANYNTDTTFKKAISLTALIILLVNIFLIAFFFSYLCKKDKVPKILQVLVEGINNNNQQESKQYFTILLIKKTLFICNLVLFQGLLAAQSLITACLSGVFSCYIYIYQPFENNYENIKIFITEILIMLNVILFSVYDIIKFDENKKSAEVLGWINVGGFTLILIFTLAIDVYQQLKKYILKCRKQYEINQNQIENEKK